MKSFALIFLSTLAVAQVPRPYVALGPSLMPALEES